MEFNPAINIESTEPKECVVDHLSNIKMEIGEPTVAPQNVNYDNRESTSHLKLNDEIQLNNYHEIESNDEISNLTPPHETESNCSNNSPNTDPQQAQQTTNNSYNYLSEYQDHNMYVQKSKMSPNINILHEKNKLREKKINIKLEIQKQKLEIDRQRLQIERQKNDREYEIRLLEIEKNYNLKQSQIASDEKIKLLQLEKDAELKKIELELKYKQIYNGSGNNIL